MAYVSLYRKYRPQTFKEILGQEHISRTLANAIVEDRVAHAYLFTGPRGTGKTSTARILAKALNCEKGPTPEPCGKCESCIAIAQGSSLDVIEMDAASHSKVEETREILTGVALATSGGRRKVYVIDEVHMLTTQSFNALLKTLEEPPPHVVFVLATTEAHKVLPTIVSRTQRFDFRRIPAETIAVQLTEVARSEQIEIEPEALGIVARHSEGSARDALSMLDQLRSFGVPVSDSEVETMLGARDEDAQFDLFEAIASGDVGEVFAIVHRLVSQGSDVRRLTLTALEHARSLMLLKAAPDAGGLLDLSEEDRERLEAQTERFTGGSLMRILDLVGAAWAEMRSAPNHRLLLEVALARSAAPDTDPSAAGLLGRLERLERRIGIEESAGPAEERAAPASKEKAAPAPATPERRPAKPPPRRAAKKAAEEVPGPAPAPQPAEPVAAPASQESAAPTPASAADHLGLNHVKDAWPVTLKEVGRISKRVGGLLNPSRPVRFDDGILAIEVQSGFHAEMMGDERNRSIVSEALHSSLGIRPRLVFVERGTDPAAAEAPAEEHEDEAASAADAAAADADAADAGTDPVELVKKGLGAEVVEERNES